MLDAAPAISLITKMLKTTYKRLSKKQDETAIDVTDLLQDKTENNGVTNIFESCWNSNQDLVDKAQELSATAQNHHETLTGNYEKRVLLFEGWGKKFLKQAGFGPEVASMAMQLASYRLLGKQIGSYEAALARRFYHGRTETARPVSPESNAFVEAMGKKSYKGDEENKLYWLQEAALVHQDVQDMASFGLGVDRHLFGLSMMLQEGEDRPDLFKDPVYLRAKPLRLSTSTVCYTPGFGPVADDGLGVGFTVGADNCLFTITSRKANNYVEPFCKLLEEALKEIGDLIKDKTS